MGSSLRQKSSRERFRKCLRSFLTFLFSQVGLMGVVIGYSLAGAYLFQWLESEREVIQRQKIRFLRIECMTQLWNLSKSPNVEVSGWDPWSADALQLLKEFEVQVVSATKLEGYDGKEADDDARQWSFSGALLYSITVITTIGYGNLAPKTDTGKMVTCIYALLGIPLMLLCLSNLGQLMAGSFQFAFNRLSGCCYCPCYCWSRSAPWTSWRICGMNCPAPCGRCCRKPVLSIREQVERGTIKHLLTSATSVIQLPVTSAKIFPNEENPQVENASIKGEETDNQINKKVETPSSGFPLKNPFLAIPIPFKVDSPSSTMKKNPLLTNPAAQPKVDSPSSTMKKIPHFLFPGTPPKVDSPTNTIKKNPLLAISTSSPKVDSPVNDSKKHPLLTIPTSTPKGDSLSNTIKKNPPLMIPVTSSKVDSPKSILQNHPFLTIPTASPKVDSPTSSPPKHPLLTISAAPTKVDSPIISSKKHPLLTLNRDEGISDSDLTDHDYDVIIIPDASGNSPSSPGGEIKNHYGLEKLNDDAKSLVDRCASYTTSTSGSRLRHQRVELSVSSIPTVLDIVPAAEPDRRSVGTNYSDSHEGDYRMRSHHKPRRLASNKMMLIAEPHQLAKVPVVVVMAFLVGYICLGALVFSTWEEWSFLDGAYFSFITLSTIGFGDLVPGSKVLEESQAKLATCILYLVVGLAGIAMSFNLVQEEVVTRFRQLGTNMGILDEK